MKEQSNNFFVRAKEKMKTLFNKGENTMSTRPMRLEKNEQEINGIPFFEVLPIMIIIITRIIKRNFEVKLLENAEKKVTKVIEVDKDSQFLSSSDIIVKDFLQYESPKTWKIRRDNQYEKIKLNLSNVEAMKRANEETIFYNKNTEAIEEVERLKDEGIKNKEMIIQKVYSGMEQEFHGRR